MNDRLDTSEEDSIWPISFFVPGKPASQGSKSVMFNHAACTKNGDFKFIGDKKYVSVDNMKKYTFIIDADSSNKAWRKHIAQIAVEHYDEEPLDEPMVVYSCFFRCRPQAHYTAKGVLNKLGKETPRPGTKPDSFKMMRSVEDALEGIIYTQDSRIVRHIIDKCWSDEPGVFVQIWPYKDCPVRVEFS